MAEERAKARASFSQRGESLTAWAIARGYNPGMVRGVLDGMYQCTRGQAHRIAVDLGLKPAA
ncbi:hypothetical protein LC612_40085 [Nostoc sp. CHAB 5834]|nr:hypothetical protein [Nostoc sp. CHAB 5834]